MNTLISLKKTTPLLFVALALINFGLLTPVKAVDPSDTFYGTGAGNNTTNGVDNSAFGFDALYSDTSGFANTAVGYTALLSNTTGSFNTANGVGALNNNTTGNTNTANGLNALLHNSTGFGNTANGGGALNSNTTGNENTANGVDALNSNTTGNTNIALGFAAGLNLTTGDNNIDIGNEGVAGESNTIRIGTQGTHTATYVAGINGAGVMGVAVKVNAAGQLGTPPSAARYKDEIKPMDKASEAILALKPVTFRYKKQIDPERIQQFGLVAEDVERINPALVARDAEGKVYTVRYDAVNAMLLNEFLKEHRKVEQMQKEIEALTAGLQKVSAQLELNKPAPQTVLNNR